jgi:DnaJ domain
MIPPTFVRRCQTMLQTFSPNNRMSTARNLGSSSGRGTDPYLILGVPPSSSIQTVQKAFHKLAFKYHPDVSGKTAVSEEFIRIRNAYERIRGCNGNETRMHEDKSNANHHDPSSYSFTEADFLDHFHRQTGVRLTSDQRQEMVHLYRSRVHGGYYGGHSWDLARRLVAEQDAFLRNMQQGGPNRRDSSFQQAVGNVSASSDRPLPTGSNLRRPRNR